MVELQLHVVREPSNQTLGMKVIAVKSNNEIVVLVEDVAPNSSSALAGLRVRFFPLLYYICLHVTCYGLRMHATTSWHISLPFVVVRYLFVCETALISFFVETLLSRRLEISCDQPTDTRWIHSWIRRLVSIPSSQLWKNYLLASMLSLSEHLVA